ncbi:MAG: ankyrin repeat domain-containing protein [Legionella sp.]|nr:ankyrin repeat domain-containing protein [Legionella sp.]
MKQQSSSQKSSYKQSRQQKSSQMTWANHYFDLQKEKIPNRLILDHQMESPKREVTHGTIDEEKEKHPYLRAIEKIVTDMSTLGHASEGADYGWFANTSFSYARASIKDRFIFLVGLDRNQHAVLIVIDINDEHNYKKYKETNEHSKAAFANYIKEHKDILTKHGIISIKGHPKTIDLTDGTASILQDAKSMEAEAPLHQGMKEQSSIEFSATQQLLIDEMGMQWVNGPPGTGKSLILLKKCAKLTSKWMELASHGVEMAEKCLALAAEGQCPITILQPRESLTSATKEMYEKLNPLGSKDLVEFRTYVEWARQFFPNKTDVGFAAFNKWLQGKDYDGKFKHEQERLALYNEMQIAAGCLEPSLYLAVGDRSTRLEKGALSKSGKQMGTQKAEGAEALTPRGTVLTILNDYLADEVDKKGQVDFSLCEPNIPEESFSNQVFLGVDECQDIPLVGLKAIMKHKKLREISQLFGDDHQTTNNNAAISCVPILKTNYYALTGKELAVKTLVESYRNPKVVIDFAQTFLTLKLSMDQGKTSKEQYTTYKSSQKSRPGQLMFKETVSLENLPFDTAVIVSDESTKAALLADYPKLFVITAHEAKGLEFEHIILYQLFEDKRLNGVEKHLKSLLSGPEKHRKSFDQSDSNLFNALLEPKNFNRTKDKGVSIQNNEAAQCLNEIFVSISRSKRTVTYLASVDPANPRMNQLAKERIESIMQAADTRVPTDERVSEESKEGDFVEESKEGDRASISQVRTEMMLPSPHLPEKNVFEEKITSFIANHQFALAEAYAEANQHWFAGFDADIFVSALLEKTTDKRLRLIGELRRLLKAINLEGNKKKALLKLSDENNYEELFKCLAKLTQEDVGVFSILLHLVKNETLFDGLNIAGMQIEVKSTKKKKSIIDYLINVIKNNAKQKNEDIDQLLLHIEDMQRKRMIAPTEQIPLVMDNPVRGATKKTNKEKQYQASIEEFLKLTDAKSMKEKLESIASSINFHQTMFEVQVDGKTFIEHLFMNAKCRDIFMEWICERDKAGTNLTVFYVGMQENPQLFKAYFEDKTLQEDAGLLFLLSLRDLEDDSLFAALEYPCDLMALFLKKFGNKVFAKTNDSLLLRIVGRDIFSRLIVKNSSKIISKETLCSIRLRDNLSALHWLSATPKGREHFLDMLKINEKFLSTIPLETWCTPIKNNTSPLLYLSGQVNGQDILTKLFNSKEWLDWLNSDVFIKALCQIQPDGTSALYWLVTTIEGRRLLCSFLEENKTFCSSVPVETLCSINKQHNLSAFYSLVAGQGGHEVLQHLLKHNKDFRSSISLEALCKPCTLENTSALYWLAGLGDEAQAILKELLSANKELNANKDFCFSLFIQALCLPSKKAGNRSAIYFLAGSDGGRHLLRELLDDQEALCSSFFIETLSKDEKTLALFIETLCLPVGDNKISALIALARSGYGIHVLDKLLSVNKDVYFSIPMEAWFERSLQDNGSAFHYLMSFTEGEKLFSKMLAANPTFLSLIPTAAWFEVCTDDNVSPIYYLPGNEGDGLVIFEKLLTNKEIVSSITIETLRTTSKSRNTSMFYWLSENQKSQKLLDELIKANKALLSLIDKEMLCTLYKGKKVSPLYKLASTERGQAFLEELFTANKALLSEIPNEEWWTVYEKNNDSFIYLLMSNNTGRKLFETFDEKEDLLALVPHETWFAPCKDDNTSMFYWLISYPKGLDLLNQLVSKSKELLNVISIKTLTEVYKQYNNCVFSKLASTEKGREFLKTLFTANKELLSEIPAETLFAPNSNANLSAFYWLTTTQNGEELLKDIFAANEKLLSDIPAEALYARHHSDNTSAFYCMLFTESGERLLQEIFTRHEALLSQIPKETLYDRDPSDNTSVFYKLTDKDSKLEWLQKIFAANEKLLSDIPAEALYARYPSDNTSAFYCMLFTENGERLLQEIFTRNEALLSQIPKETLYDRRPSDNTSVFYKLTDKDSKIEWLQKIFTANKELFSGMPEKSLSALCSRDNTSAIYWLSKKTMGKGLLNQLANENEALISSIPVQTLCSPNINQEKSTLYFLCADVSLHSFLGKLIDVNLELLSLDSDVIKALSFRYQPDNRSGLYYLTMTESGRKILEKLFSKNPKWFSYIPAETWCALDTKQNVSMWYWLGATESGRKFLEKLLTENKELLSLISVDTLCELRRWDNDSLLSRLAVSEQRLVFLEKIMASNEGSLSSIPIDKLCAVNKEDNNSAFLAFTSTLKGQALLEKILSSQENAFSSIPMEVLCAVNKEENISAFYALAFTSNGQALLEKILSSQENAFSSIPMEVLCAVNKEDNTSAFYALAFTPNGQALLEKILSSQENAFSSIPMEMLFAVRKEDNTSAFCFLAATPRGLGLLEKIMVANEELLSSVPIETWCSMERRRGRGNLAIFWFAVTEGRGWLEKLTLGNIPLSVSLQQKISTLMEETTDQRLKADYRIALWILKEINNELTIDAIPFEMTEDSIKDKLDLSAKIGFKHTLQLLLERNNNQYINVICGRASLLYSAVDRNQRAVIDFLLKQNADVNLVSKDYSITPLFIAAQNGHEEIVELLLEYNADPTIPYETTEASLLNFSRNNSDIVRKNMEEYISTYKDGKSNVENKIRVLPYDIAMIMGHPQIAHRIESFTKSDSLINGSYSSIFSAGKNNADKYENNDSKGCSNLI